MNKTIIVLALLGAVAIMLYQVVNWKQVADEYQPVVNAYNKVVNMIPTDAEIIESVPEPEADIDKVLPVPAIADPTAVTWKNDNSSMIVDPSEDEISNISYDWLKRMSSNAYPGFKDDLKEALDNDGMIREDEYYILLARVNEYNNAQEGHAKTSLRKMLAE